MIKNKLHKSHIVINFYYINQEIHVLVKVKYQSFKSMENTRNPFPLTKYNIMREFYVSKPGDSYSNIISAMKRVWNLISQASFC